MTKIRCSFCQRQRPTIKRIFKGNKAHIRDEYIHLCSDLLKGEEEIAKLNNFVVPKQSGIKFFLHEYAKRRAQ